MNIFLIFVKSDIKRYFRDKSGLAMALVFPIITIFILTSAFSNIMNEDFTLDPFTIGYSIASNNPLKPEIAGITEDLKKSKITLVERSNEEGLLDTKNGLLAGFVNFGDKDATFYKNDKMEISTSIFQSILENIAYTTGTYTQAHKYMAQNKQIVEIPVHTDKSPSLVALKKLSTIPSPSSKQYYGIAMIINNIMFALVGAASLIAEDRKYRVNQRIALSNANPFTLFFARITSMFAISLLSILIIVTSARILLNVDFGSNLPLIFSVMVLFAFAANTMGVALGYLFKNISLARALILGGAFFLNYFGGCYQPYTSIDGTMLSLMEKSPIYYINRSLIEISTSGQSTYLPTALMIIAVTIFTSIIVGVIVYTKGEGEINYV